MVTQNNIVRSPRLYRSKDEALAAGQMSKSQWKRNRRVVLDDAIPDYVVTRTIRADLSGSPPSIRDMYVIVREIDDHLVEVYKDGWCVYSLDQTKPSPTSKRNDSGRKQKKHAPDGHSPKTSTVNNKSPNST